MVDNKTPLAKRLKTALLMRNMKQSELCEKTKIPKSAMSQYMSGSFEPKQDRIYIIAKALDVSEAWLMGYDVPLQKPIPENETTDERHERWLKEFEKLSDNGKQLLLDSIKRLEALSPEQREIFLAMFQGALASQQKDQPK
jgi:transcriptional regulator with XRE-family HTH domain